MAIISSALILDISRAKIAPDASIPGLFHQSKASRIQLFGIASRIRLETKIDDTRSRYVFGFATFSPTCRGPMGPMVSRFRMRQPPSPKVLRRRTGLSIPPPSETFACSKPPRTTSAADSWPSKEVLSSGGTPDPGPSGTRGSVQRKCFFLCSKGE